jgi:hypothetical protein
VLSFRFVWRLLKASGFTKKSGAIINRRKYEQDNVVYWSVYVTGIVFIPIETVHYLDEATFCDGDLRPTKGWSEAGNPLATVAAVPINTHSYTCFCLSDLRNGRGFWLSHPHSGRNTSIDFIGFIVAIFSLGAIRAGDVLVIDSAPIHTSRISVAVVSRLCDLLGARLVFLPKYSPELNPVEMIWGMVKNQMRNRRGSDSFGVELMRAFARVDVEQVRRFYRHCLFRWFEEDGPAEEVDAAPAFA